MVRKLASYNSDVGGRDGPCYSWTVGFQSVDCGLLVFHPKLYQCTLQLLNILLV